MLTLETLPLTQEGAEELLRRQAPTVPAANLPLAGDSKDGRTRRRSSAIRTLPPRADAPASQGKLAPARRERKPASAGAPKAILALGGAVFLAGLAALLLAASPRPARTANAEPPVREAEPAAVQPHPAAPTAAENGKTASPAPDPPVARPEPPEATDPLPVPAPEQPLPDPVQERFDRLMALPGATSEERDERVAAAEAFLKGHPESLFAARVSVALDEWKLAAAAEAAARLAGNDPPSEPAPAPTPVEPPTGAPADPPAAERTSSSPPFEPQKQLLPLPLAAIPGSEKYLQDVSKDLTHGANINLIPLQGGGFELLGYNRKRVVRAKLSRKGDFLLESAARADTQWIFEGDPPIWWDLNADGLADAWNGKYVCLGDGAGGFTSLGFSARGGWIDLDGDGACQEFFQGGPSGAAVIVQPQPSLWPSRPPNALEVATAWTAKDRLGVPANAAGRGNSFPFALSADLDGDHRSELLVYFNSGRWSGAHISRTWVLSLKNPGAGALGWVDTTKERGLPQDDAQHLIPEDFDADGDLDLINPLNGELWTNDGRGQFAKSEARLYPPKRPLHKGANPPSSGQLLPKLLDLDNNGWRDLIYGDSNYGIHYGVFLNFGGGRFLEGAAVATLSDGMAFADLDGDGDLDAAAILENKPVLYRNDTPGKGLHLRVQPRLPVMAFLGCKLWVCDPARKDEHGQPRLIHYRQGIYPQDLHPLQHVGLGNVETVDLKVRFISGAERWVRGVKTGTEVIVRE
ncbi:MAG: hypothetical protein M5U26_12265 [Planctomycetota bacterium]|nr:hypothetical protein [Planctomycetota bacterium]